jgi:hypothetical protein
VFDDFIPAISNQQTLFSYSDQKDLWIPMLQKAYAKTQKNYLSVEIGDTAEMA